MRSFSIAVIFVSIAVGAAVLSCGKVGDSDPASIHDIQLNQDVLQVAQKVIEAFKAQNGKRLASLVHPKKGVRFSPSAFVDVANDVVLMRLQVETIWSDKTPYAWGYADGTGDPIVMSPSEYCKAYVMDRDFSKPSSVNVNNDQVKGNTTNNVMVVYPLATRVEYFIEPSSHDNQPGLDWAALRLVFEKEGDTWFLVGVIHDEWST